MATNEEVLRAFVVSLGWKNEAAEQKQFVGAIESATLKANLLADGIVAMAKSVSGAIEKRLAGLPAIRSLSQPDQNLCPDISRSGHHRMMPLV